MPKKSIRIGCGGAWEYDLIPPAVLMAEKGDLQYLCAEHLAERTLGLAQQRKAEDPSKGYNPLLDKRIKALWPVCSKNGITFISNMGAANPVGAAAKTLEIIQDMGLKTAKVAAVAGDDIRDVIKDVNPLIWETGKPLNDLSDRLGKDLVSANAYLGAEPIVEALTVDRVKGKFNGIVKGKITRYEAPVLKALNFVMEEALNGGVSRSLSLDKHGKSFSLLMLDIDIDVPDDYSAPRLG
jgi:hypothetical protein